MNSPKWNADGEPENLEAAAMDAVEWLRWLCKFSVLVTPGERKKLDDCISEILKRVK